MTGSPLNLMHHLRAGKQVLMDGAMGTELERRGVPFEGSGWSAYAVRDHDSVIRQVHRDYVDCGARLHIVNSFALARHVLEPLGIGNLFDSLNRKSVAVCEAAIEESGHRREDHWVAGSLSTFCANSDRSLLPRGDALVKNYRDQAQILQQAGVDLFAFEMLFDVETSLAMIQATEGLGLPVILGFTCDWGLDENSRTVTTRPMGRPAIPLDTVLPEVIAASRSMDTILSIMHSQFDVTNAALAVLKRYWEGPIAIYPNSGTFVDLHMQFDSVCPAGEFKSVAVNWKRQGAQIIGGCCGLGPKHINALADQFD